METVFIVGKGSVDVTTIGCTLCGDEGIIVTGWEDGGDAENGPGEPSVASFVYCACARGVAAKADDDAETESYIAMRMEMEHKTRAQVFADLAQEKAAEIEHSEAWYAAEEARWEARTEARNR